MSEWPNLEGWLGLDIGGANLKIAGPGGFALERPFALWRAPDRLEAELAGLLALAPPHRGVAVTTTGELADCYRSKAEGVRAILGAARRATQHGMLLRVYSTAQGGNFLHLEDALLDPMPVAAANWLALAHWVAHEFQIERGLLVDTGSTTTDVIPLQHGKAAPTAVDDRGRLASGELVYTGMLRTPVAAIVSELPYRGTLCPVATEWFANAGDAHLLLGTVSAGSMSETADGRPHDPPHARARLARCLCLDPEELTESEARLVAQAIARRQAERIAAAIWQVASAAGRGDRPIERIIVSGSGAPLALDACRWALPGVEAQRLEARFGPQASRCVAALAVACLAAAERSP